MIRFGLLFLIIQLAFFFVLLVGAQTEISFTSKEKFEIPSNNCSINFATNGSYRTANLQDGFWIFEDLSFPTAIGSEKLNIKVSASDCNLTIFPFQIAYYPYGEAILKWVIMRYTVSTQGIQIINLGFDAKNGQLDVIIDGEFIGRNLGWSLSTDGTFTITEATENVTLWYIGYPELKTKVNFLDEHYVLIGSGFFISSIVVFSVFITQRKRKLIDIES